MTTHPLADAAIRALTDLAAWTPANADELARVLESVHAVNRKSIITVLDAALGNLAAAAFGLDGLTPEQSHTVSTHLETAAEHISGAACDWIDRAREATGVEWAR